MPNNEALKAALDYLQQEPDASLRKETSRLLAESKNGSPLADAQIRDRFSGRLAFGTAGIRAKMQAGFNRLNLVTVAKTAFAIGTFFADKLRSEGIELNTQCIIVGRDARLQSDIFADEIISIFRGFGFQVYGFDGPVATPVCAFAVRNMKAAAGVMVTASHNPPADNGIKVYGSNGAQIVSPDDRQIEQNLQNAPSYQNIVRAPQNNDERSFLVPQAVLEAYFDSISKAQISPAAARSRLRVVYTPMHGVGFRFVHTALSSCEFIELLPVEAQKEPDGNFPTLSFPNPEEDGALDLAIYLATKQKADLIIANDPDADRLAVAVPFEDGRFKMLSGNELGAVLGCDVLENGSAQKRKLVISTLVSSRLLGAMATACGASYAESLTGFSRIAEISFEREAKHSEQFVFGYEEALGYCVGDFVRDKDGICAAVRLLERAALLKAQGKTIWDELDRIHSKYGVFRNRQWSIRFSGVEAQEQMQSLMNQLRDLKAGSSFFRSETVIKFHDLLKEPYKDFKIANILIYFLADGTRVVVRPSGTEPKVKFYAEKMCQLDVSQSPKSVYQKLDHDLDGLQRNVMNVLDGGKNEKN